MRGARAPRAAPGRHGPGVIVLDGALGTLLAARGVPAPPPAWSAAAVRSHPEVLRDIHRAYAAAGAQVHTAATFRTTPRAVGADAWPLTRDAVALAREAVPADHRVAGSLAPLEDCYRPDLSPPSPGPEHARHAEHLARAGVDLVLVETFAHVGEALAATEAALRTGLPVWTALSPGYRGDLLDPHALADGARAAAALGAERVLVNCLPAIGAAPFVAALAAVGVPWGIHANAGAPEDGLHHGQPGAAEAYGRLAAGWAAAGASVIGGCCGTGPAHIACVTSLSSPQPGIDDDRYDG
ncbi:MAG: homocysteine S-methyltransferase family protein [Alphaproteobacteria bacterium]|nr:homocysteine S-methyltransferase family protein [Alphaproteobacteria bacterium]